MLHLVQNCYEFSAPWEKPEQMWMIEASATWFEEKFSDNLNYLSHNQLQFLLDVGGGLQQSNSPPFGYCHSFVIKDLHWNQGNQGIVDLFQKIKDGTLPNNPTDPIDALEMQIQDPIDLYWHAVGGAYFLGYYYNKKLALAAIDTVYKWNQNNLLDKNLPYGSLENPLQDLSAKLLVFDLADCGWTADDKVNFVVTEAATTGLIAFKYKRGKEISLLKEVEPGGSGELVIENPESLFIDGYSIGVVITNCHTSSDYKAIQNIILDVEITDGNVGSDTRLIVPDKMEMIYWKYRTSGMSTDTAFILQVVNPPKVNRPHAFIRQSDQHDHWYEMDPLGNDISERVMYPVTFSKLSWFGGFLPPDTTIHLQFKILTDDNQEVQESVELSLSGFFDGVIIDRDEWTYYPYHEVRPFTMRGPCNYPMIKLSISGNSLTGTIDQTDYRCDYSNGVTDTTRIYTTKCDFSISFNGNQVTGSQHWQHHVRFTVDEKYLSENAPYELEFTETYSFSSILDYDYPVNASNYYSDNKDLYEFEIGHKDIVGQYNLLKKMYKKNGADSIFTETKSFQSEQERDRLYFSAYVQDK